MRRRAFVQTLGAAAAVGRIGAAHDDPRQWRVDPALVNDALTGLGRFGRAPEGGYSRIGYGDADREGREYTLGLMKAAGLIVEVDPSGNLIGRRPGSLPGALPILFGSHIDSVPNGGNFDGGVGSMAAVAVAKTLLEKRYDNRHPLWVTIWADEESGLTGSRGFLGELSAEELSRPGHDGVPLADKIRRVGGAPERIGATKHERGSIAAYVELHIEQGGTLDRSGVAIGVVQGIVGIRGFDVVITGFANHAGTTPMDQRHNALLAAAELIQAVDRIVRARPGRQVGTVGRIGVKPGAQNVIPGEATLTIELRDLSMDTLEALWVAIRSEADAIMAKHGTSWQFSPRPTNQAALADPAIMAVIGGAAKTVGLTTTILPSGAGHDAQDMARIGPMGMIFVPSVGGISHSPKEFTKPEDVANGAHMLLQTIVELDRQLP